MITEGSSVEGTLDRTNYFVELIGVGHLLDRGYSREDMEKILGGTSSGFFGSNGPADNAL